MGLLTFSINVTLDGCVEHQEGIAGDETHAFLTRLTDEGGAPKYVVSSTRKDSPWKNSHHIAGDLRAGVQKLKDATFSWRDRTSRFQRSGYCTSTTSFNFHEPSKMGSSGPYSLNMTKKP